MTTAAEYIAGWEGYAGTAYWDVNHYRIGYGSDTEGPEQVNVVQGMTTTRERALQNLALRVPQFQKVAIKAMGADAWAKLTDNQKSAITSLVYNYGRLPIIVYPSDPEKTAKAIEALQGANGGVNRKRRLGEAKFYLSTGAAPGKDKPKAGPVVAGGTAGGAVALAIWQYLSTAGPGTAEVLFAGNIVLGLIVFYLVAKLMSTAPTEAAPATPTKYVSDAAALLQQAIDNRDAGKKALTDLENEVELQKTAVQKAVAELQAQISQAEGLAKP